MNYLSLRYFLEVASQLNFSQAAKNLHISQPALSQQISTLEENIGFKLFNRNTRKISLTTEGEYLFNQIKPSFQSIDRTIGRMTKYQTIPTEKIKIATIPTAVNKYIPYIFEKIINIFPNIETFLLETSSPNGEALVKRQAYDMAFIRTPINRESFQESNIGILEIEKNPLKFIVSKEHPLAKKYSIDLKEAQNEYFIHYDENNAPSLSYLFHKVCYLSELTPKKLCTVSELFTIFNLVANNLGVSIIPGDIVKLMNSNQIKALDIKNIPTLHSSISVIWNKGNLLSINVVDKIVSTLKSLALHKYS